MAPILLNSEASKQQFLDLFRNAQHNDNEDEGNEAQFAMPFVLQPGDLRIDLAELMREARGCTFAEYIEQQLELDAELQEGIGGSNAVHHEKDQGKLAQPEEAAPPPGKSQEEMIDDLFKNCLEPHQYFVWQHRKWVRDIIKPPNAVPHPNPMLDPQGYIFFFDDYYFANGHFDGIWELGAASALFVEDDLLTDNMRTIYRGARNSEGLVGRSLKQALQLRGTNQEYAALKEAVQLHKEATIARDAAFVARLEWLFDIRPVQEPEQEPVAAVAPMDVEVVENLNINTSRNEVEEETEEEGDDGEENDDYEFDEIKEVYMREAFYQ